MKFVSSFFAVLFLALTVAQAQHQSGNLSSDTSSQDCASRYCATLVSSLLTYVNSVLQINPVYPTHTPNVHFISPQHMYDKACQSKVCSALGWFSYKDNTVYMLDRLDVTSNIQAQSILLHELVHYAQSTINQPLGQNPCLTWKAREFEAYGIQRQWLHSKRMSPPTPSYVLGLINLRRTRCRG